MSTRANQRKTSQTEKEEEKDISKTLTIIHNDIKELKEELKKTVKEDGLELVVKKIVNCLIEENNRRTDEIIDKKCAETEKRCSIRVEKVERELDKVEAEVIALENKFDSKNKEIRELRKRLDENVAETKRAVNKSSYNEQYSRKTNFKITGIHEEEREKTQEKAIKIVRDLADVELKEEEMLACHRIPRPRGKDRPILVKVRNSDVKSRVMRKRKIVREKGKGVRFVDDVTTLNAELITSLLNHERIESAWYFNGAVYGKPHGMKRMMFVATDKDDIDSKLKGCDDNSEWTRQSSRL